MVASQLLALLLLILVLCRKQKAHQRVFQSMRHAIFQSARCAGFSPDGKFVATGSSNTSIKLFVVSKIKQMMLPEARDGPVRPVIHTFYDHLKPRRAWISILITLFLYLCQKIRP
ncbi:uncharacterized protein [Malus domestica]|uniref:uncharacterized protein isoform X1 n=1 Tax=Malus domestica TaxID=3750 RepID=UPI0010AA9761|nr:uncharacterized protein LOC103455437 [Malus domestica]